MYSLKFHNTIECSGVARVLREWVLEVSNGHEAFTLHKN